MSFCTSATGPRARVPMRLGSSIVLLRCMRLCGVQCVSVLVWGRIVRTWLLLIVIVRLVSIMCVGCIGSMRLVLTSRLTGRTVRCLVGLLLSDV